MADDPEDARRKEFAERWEKEWGPEVPPARRALIGILALAGFIGFIALVLSQAEWW